MRSLSTPSAAARPGPLPPDTPRARPPGPEGSVSDSIFEASGFERGLGRDAPAGLIGWRRRALVLAALLGCLAVFTLARWLTAQPYLGGTWATGPAGELWLRAQPPAAPADRHVVALENPSNGLRLPVDATLLHRWPRWQMDDTSRVQQVAQHEGLAQLLADAAQAPAPDALLLRLADGSAVSAAVTPRGYAGLGLLYWPLAGVALLLYLFAVVMLLARPQARNLLFVGMAFCQSGNLLFMAVEMTLGLGLPAGIALLDMPVRAALDLGTGAAIVHVFALHPLRLARARWIASCAWAGAAAVLLLSQTGLLHSLWWWTQASCAALGAAALAVARHSHRTEPNPYALVLWRLAAAGLVTLVLATAAVAVAAGRPASAPGVVAATAVAWSLFLAALLMLTPFLARSRQVLREFALLAGISTVATSLDLLFVAVFSLGTFTSLAMAVFIGVGLYAGARQYVLHHLIGSNMLTTERTFDQLYRAARAVQARPAQYPQLLSQLLGDLFEPLEVLRVARVPVRARVIGGGAALVVPMRGADEESPAGLPSTGPYFTAGPAIPAGTAGPGPATVPPAAPSAALLLRFAHRGQRLFTLDDARLADRVVDQLRRAVAYDQAVERGRTEERVRIAQDLHDDIGARLLTLMYQAPTREMEDYIRHTLLDLKTLTRGLAAAEQRLSHAAAEWKSDLTQRLTAAHVRLGWSFNCDRDLRLSVVQWSALTRVLRELVSNALYHGHASRIDVAFTLQAAHLHLQVTDDGDGRAPQGWAHGLGLGGVRKRVKALGGTVAWLENGERGIVCTVNVTEFHSRH